MRVNLIHAYFDVDLDILWQTVSEDLPALLEQLEVVLAGFRLQSHAEQETK